MGRKPIDDTEETDMVPLDRSGTGSEVVYDESETDIINAMLAEAYDEDSPESIALHLLLDEE